MTCSTAHGNPIRGKHRGWTGIQGDWLRGENAVETSRRLNLGSAREIAPARILNCDFKALRGRPPRRRRIELRSEVAETWRIEDRIYAIIAGAQPQVGTGHGQPVDNGRAGNGIDKNEAPQYSVVSRFAEAPPAQVMASFCFQVNRVVTTGGSGVTGRSMRTTRARYATLNRYFDPSASQMRRMSSRLRSAITNRTLSVALHAPSAVRIELSRIGDDCSCWIVQPRMVCSACALVPQ